MTTWRQRDPAALRWLARRVPPGALGDSVLGDLAEEHAAARRQRGALRAALWLWFAALAIGLRWPAVRALRRLRSLLPERRPPRPPLRSSGDPLVTHAAHDLRYSLRSLRRKPGFAAIVIVTLAVGIAVNATVFSVFDALVLRPFPIPTLDRLAAVSGTIPAQGFFRDQLSPADYLSYREASTVFEDLVAETWWSTNLTGVDRPERLQGRRVTPGFLDVLGVQPVLGRTLGADRGAGDRRSVVLSHRLWTERLEGDPEVVGETLELDGERYEVVGVAPEDFGYPQGSELWATLVLGPEERADRSFQYLSVLGRLRDEKTVEDAQAELAVIAQRLESEHPDTNRGRGVYVQPLADAVVDIGAPTILSAWQIATLFVLLIACVNVANLLIARGGERAQEVSLRAALGARRRRIVRLLFTESLLLALAGAALGMPLVWLGTRIIRDSLPYRIARYAQGWKEIDVDGRVLAFTVLAACSTALVFGLLPAWRASRSNLVSALHDGARNVSGGGRRLTGRSLLVAAEIALALVLVVASALTIRGAYRLMYGDQGYRTAGILAGEVSLPEEQYPDDPARRALLDEALRRARALPGVVGAEATSILPSTGNNNHRSIEVEGAPSLERSELPSAHFRVATAGFLELLEIPILSGRGLDARDREGTLPVAVVSESMATRLWPDQDALGKRFRPAEDEDSPWLTVVGVCGDVLHDWFLGTGRPTFYQPYQQRARRTMTLVVEARGDPLALTNELRSIVADLDPELPLYNIATVEQLIADRTIGLRFMASLMSIFGMLAVGLAAIGIYGLVSFAVARSRREIGLRLALGAQKRDVLRHTLRHALITTAIGLLAGMALAYGVARLMASNLFGIIRMEPLAFVQSPLLLALLAVGATLVPAWRATRLDPAKTLRDG